MKLIAFDHFNVVVIDDNGIAGAYYKNGSSPRVLTANAVERLPHIGFKSVEVEISSLEEAWKIVESEKLKNLRFIM